MTAVLHVLLPSAESTRSRQVGVSVTRNTKLSRPNHYLHTQRVAGSRGLVSGRAQVQVQVSWTADTLTK